MPDQVVKVNVQMLQSVLWHCRRAQPVSLIARTVPRMLKTGNPFYDAESQVFDLVRIRQLTGFVNFDYARCVNRERKKEGRPADFESQGRSWGKRQYAIAEDPAEIPRVPSQLPRRRTPLVRHGSKWYLDLKRQNVCKTEHRTLTTNELIDDEQLAPFLRPDNGLYEKRRQHVERPIIIRDYALCNIAQLSLEGTLYLVDPCPHRNLSQQSCGASSRSTDSTGRRSRRAA